MITCMPYSCHGNETAYAGTAVHIIICALVVNTQTNSKTSKNKCGNTIKCKYYINLDRFFGSV